MYYIEVLKEYKKKFEDAKKLFAEAGEDVSKASLWQVIKFRKKYGFNISDYFLYQLYNHTKDTPLEYVSTSEVERLPRLLNDYTKRNFYFDKVRAYGYYGKYYKRDFLFVTTENKDEFLELANKHKELIIKPTGSYGGNGVIRVKTDNPSELYDSLINEYERKFVAEEPIKQAQSISKLHPSSINTLRVPTIRFDDEVVPHHVVLRCGSGGSVIDGMHGGGILGYVDMKTGEILSACDSNGVPLTKHPTTNEDFVGFKIPRIDEALELSKELAEVLPEYRWVGWDLALTEDGWIMVEGNSAPQVELYERASRTGMYSDIRSYYEQLGKLDEFNKIVKR